MSASPAGCPGAWLFVQPGAPQLLAGSRELVSTQRESLGSAEAACGPGDPALSPRGLRGSGRPVAPPAGSPASWGPPPLTVLCSSPIAARGPRRRCPSSRRDPHPAPAGSGGTGSARLAAPLLLPGPSSGAGAPRAPSGEPVLPGRGAPAARPGPLLLLPVLRRGRAPPRGRRGPHAPAPHAERGGAGAPAHPGRGRGVRREAAVSPTPSPVPAAGHAGRAARGRWSEGRGACAAARTGSAVGARASRRGPWARGRSGRPFSAPASPSAVLAAPHPTPLAHTSPHVHTRAGTRALTHTHTRSGCDLSRDALSRSEFTLGLNETFPSREAALRATHLVEVPTKLLYPQSWNQRILAAEDSICFSWIHPILNTPTRSSEE